MGRDAKPGRWSKLKAWGLQSWESLCASLIYLGGGDDRSIGTYFTK